MRGFEKLGYLVLVLGVSAGIATAQSLADVAKKEKKRRATNQSESKTVITDRELTKSHGSGLPAQAQQASLDTEEDDAGSSDETEVDEEGESQEDETKTEEYWRGRVNGAKAKIARLEERLATDDWGNGQRAGVDPRGLTNLTSREKAEQDLTAARAELTAIRAEARRAGVPPGWVR